MRKFITVILINIFIFIALLASLDFYISKNLYSLHETIFTLKNSKFDFLNKDIDVSNYQIEPMMIEKWDIQGNECSFTYCCEERINFSTKEYNKKPPIFILGCSYAFGHALKKENTFPNILSNQTKRSVYSFAECGKQILFSLQKMKAYATSNNISAPEYIVYVYMYDHINRFFFHPFSEEDLNFLFELSFIEKQLIKTNVGRLFVKNLRTKKILKNYPTVDAKVLNFQKKIFLLAEKQVKQIYPNSKLIVVVYNEKIQDDFPAHKLKFYSETIESNIWDEIEKESEITIVKTKDLLGYFFDKNYKVEKDGGNWHPNTRAWEEFTPKFVEKYMVND